MSERDALQDLVERAADLLGAPATLEDRDFHLVAYAAHGSTIDPVRTDSIPHRRSSEEVRARFERYGIARATGPVHIPADPEADLLARLCLPVRWKGLTYGVTCGSWTTTVQVGPRMFLDRRPAEAER